MLLLLCVCVGAHVTASGRTGGLLPCSPFFLITFRNNVSHWAWYSWLWLTWLDTEPLGYSCPCWSTTRVMGRGHCIGFIFICLRSVFCVVDVFYKSVGDLDPASSPLPVTSLPQCLLPLSFHFNTFFYQSDTLPPTPSGKILKHFRG